MTAVSLMQLLDVVVSFSEAAVTLPLRLTVIATVTSPPPSHW
ncbi:MAG: hypothetical protein ACLR76_10805 [Alistipes sp.]